MYHASEAAEFNYITLATLLSVKAVFRTAPSHELFTFGFSAFILRKGFFPVGDRLLFGVLFGVFLRKDRAERSSRRMKANIMYAGP